MHWDEAVIFAGGNSSRMGRDKALLPFGGYGTLAEYQYRRLQMWFDRVALSSREEKFPFEAPVILDRKGLTYAPRSPMVALASVLAEAEADTVFVLSVDMPFVDASLIGKLYEAYHSNPSIRIAVARSNRGVEPLCGVYSRNLLPHIEAKVQEGEHRMQTLLAGGASVEVDCDRPEMFANLNTPDEYRKFYRDAATAFAESSTLQGDPFS